MSSTNSTDDATKVYDFWFGLQAVEWMKRDDELDQKIITQFGDLITKARNHELDDWAATPNSALSLLILLDQFPRNCFRGSGESFWSDGKAAEIATLCIAKGFDKEVKVPKTMFFYLPLVHSETLLAQIAAVSLFEGMLGRAKESNDEEATAYASQGVKAAQHHLDLIMEFGRFPGRNAALGRESSREEAAFLKEHPSGMKPMGPPK